jgi:hypothetical protein
VICSLSSGKRIVRQLKKRSAERKRTSIVRVVRCLLEGGIVDVTAMAAKATSMMNQMMKEQNSKVVEVVSKA